MRMRTRIHLYSVPPRWTRAAWLASRTRWRRAPRWTPWSSPAPTSWRAAARSSSPLSGSTHRYKKQNRTPKKFQNNSKNYKKLQLTTKNYKKLQKITNKLQKIPKKFQKITKNYKKLQNLQKITINYKNTRFKNKKKLQKTILKI